MAGATSNPTKRVVALLNFLARRPGRSYSLSDLSRELTISKSTLHPLVETLAEAGYLMRDESSRLIRLGPVLTGIGAAALGHRAHMVDSLRPAMEVLAHDLDAHCLVSAVFDDWIVPIAAAGEPSRVTTLFRLGARANPFAPPLGVLFLASKPMSEVQDWLDRAQPPMDPAEIELALSAVDLLRTTGVAAASRLDVKARIEKALDDYATVADESQLPDMMRELRRSQYAFTDFSRLDRVEVDWIGIPLCDERGRVDAALVVLNLPDRRNGPEMLEIATRMKDAVRAVPGVRLLAGTDERTVSARQSVGRGA
ncbi:helix-turn-helix domain-containing protein [Pseudonocardia sp. NPDC049154]|uniref:helix-turn-helix domain-containing protein n=1 Tax=Pseudonocardia sp. NPDC049154 TaxID=3155501 RepID=UPI0033C0DCE2